jgi:hypothetical protein
VGNLFPSVDQTDSDFTDFADLSENSNFAELSENSNFAELSETSDFEVVGLVTHSFRLSFPAHTGHFKNLVTVDVSIDE